MADLKRNMIELVKEVKGDEVITERYWTPPFIPFSVVYEAVDLAKKIDEGEMSDVEMFDLLIDFVVDRIYNNQFTKEELMNGIHAPDAVRILQEQVIFVSQGQQSSDTKNFLAKKK